MPLSRYSPLFLTLSRYSPLFLTLANLCLEFRLFKGNGEDVQKSLQYSQRVTGGSTKVHHVIGLRRDLVTQETGWARKHRKQSEVAELKITDGTLQLFTVIFLIIRSILTLKNYCLKGYRTSFYIIQQYTKFKFD